MTRRKFIGLTAAAAVTGASGLALARGVRREVVVNRFEVPLGRAGGLRVAHLTDLHVGWATPRERLDEALALCEELRPDLVVLTGDYVNHSLKHLGRLRAFLEGLSGLPCLATLGNHDHWSGAEAIVEVLEAGGVGVLRNEHRTLRLRAGRELAVVGVDDGYTDHADIERAFDGLRDPSEALFLTHFPNTADELVARGARLVLAGHTHGGQIDVPLATPAVARTIGNRYLAGWYEVGEGRLYVNVGLGSSALRWRVGEAAAPGVALLQLVDQEA